MEKELRTTEDVFNENMRLAEQERNRLKGIQNNTRKEKPFYISQLPEGVQNKLKDMQKKKLLDEGYSEKDAEYYADEFLNEKIYTAEEFYGNDFWERPEFKEEDKGYEVVNDKNIDAIKDNFTPPGAKSKLKDEIDTNDNGKIEVDEMADFQKSLDDYAAKNKKGRDDIPTVTTRR